MQTTHSRQLRIGTTAERTGLTLPADAQGAPFWDTDLGSLYVWTGSAWVSSGGSSGGIWLERSDGLRVSYPDLTSAIAAASAGHTIWLYPGTYSFAALVTVDKAIAIKGINPLTAIITGSASNNATLEVTVDDVRFEGLAILHTGTGTGGSCIRWATNNLTIEQCVLNTTGAANGNYVLDHQGGSSVASRIINCFMTSSGGVVNNYGYVNTTGAAKAEIYGGTINAATGDIFGNIGGSSLVVQNARVLGGGISYSGTISGLMIDAGGSSVVLGGSKTIKGIGSNVPDLGSTTAAEKWGNIYLALAKDLLPDNDIYGLWGRTVNYGQLPAEHWHQNADMLAWTGWAAYTGFATPSTIAMTSSTLGFFHSSTARKFYYRPFINAQTQLLARVAVESNGQAGVMVDDGSGSGNADGLGANNFIRWFLEAGAGGNWNFAIERRTGGGAVTKTTFSSVPAGNFYGIALIYGIGTRWSNWSCSVYLIGESSLFGFISQTSVASQAWTPTRIGLYGGPTSGSRSLFDWYTEN